MMAILTLDEIAAIENRPGTGPIPGCLEWASVIHLSRDEVLGLLATARAYWAGQDDLQACAAAFGRTRDADTQEVARLCAVVEAAKDALDFYRPLDEFGEMTDSPSTEEPYWGAKADVLRVALRATEPTP